MQNQSELDLELGRLAEELTLRREVDEHGNIYYYNEEDKLHRIYGPAVTRDDGAEFWYQNDELHRDHGPAVILHNGAEFWYQNDKRHRLDGPAVIYSNGHKLWYIDGKEYTKKGFNTHPLVMQHRANNVL